MGFGNGLHLGGGEKSESAKTALEDGKRAVGQGAYGDCVGLGKESVVVKNGIVLGKLVMVTCVSE